MDRKVALVTGGNRGIGLEVCRQLANQGIAVLLGARDLQLGDQAAQQLNALVETSVSPIQLDVRSLTSIEAAKSKILDQYGRLDILVNNAAIFRDPPATSPSDLGDRSILKAKTETILETFETNTLGPLRMCQTWVPIMQKQNYGRVVNVSSGDGQLQNMNGGKPGYRISKVSLNAITRIFWDELKGTNVLVNSVCPGWVQTRMGGTKAPKSVEKGAETVVWLALLPDGGPQGGFYRDLKPLAWWKD